MGVENGIFDLRLGRRRKKQNKKLNLLTFSFLFKHTRNSVYELQGPSLRDGKPELFRKPWAMTTVMFVGMSFCLPLAHFQEWKANKERAADAAKRQQQASSSSSSSSSNNALRSPLLEPVEEAVAYDGQGNAVAPLSKLRALKAAAGAELRRAALLSVPTAFDLVATVLMNVGLLSVTASVYQMMRGAEMLFAALFAVLFLRRRLNRWHLGGIGCCVAGIGLGAVGRRVADAGRLGRGHADRDGADHRVPGGAGGAADVRGPLYERRWVSFFLFSFSSFFFFFGRGRERERDSKKKTKLTFFLSFSLSLSISFQHHQKSRHRAPHDRGLRGPHRGLSDARCAAPDRLGFAGKGRRRDPRGHGRHVAREFRF